MIRFNKKIIFIYMFVIACNLPFGPDFYPELSYLYVTSPVKSNIWDIGSKQSISWAAQNVSFSSVKLDLYNNGTFQQNIETHITIPGQSTSISLKSEDSNLLQGDYDWLLLYTLNEGNNYNVKITAKLTESGIDTFIYAESEEFILSCNICPIYFQITSPSGGEVWNIGSSQDIEWETNSAIMDNSASNQVKIDLYKSDTYFETISTDENNDGSYEWVVANTNGLDQATNYKIRISSISEPEKHGESYKNFALKEGTYIKLTSPNGGETWALGSTHYITWTESISSSKVTIKLLRSSSPSGSYSTEKTYSNKSNNGSYSWTIPSNLSTSYYYKIRIQDYYDSSNYDESDNYFTISEETSGITVTSPNGGETWALGSSQTITWTSENISSSNVKIRLYNSSSSSGSFTSLSETIASSTDNDGSYTWNISSSLSTTKYYKIRIEDKNNSDVYDISDSYFNIVEEESSITITSPNGGETWARGSSQTITWTSENISSSNVKIRLYNSSSSSGSFTNLSETIASSTDNDGSYTWNISSSLSTTKYYKIRIEDYNDSSTYDESDASFNIN